MAIAFAVVSLPAPYMRPVFARTCSHSRSSFRAFGYALRRHAQNAPSLSLIGRSYASRANFCQLTRRAL